MWLCSPNLEAHTRLQVRHGMPPLVIGALAAHLRRSLAAAIHRRRSFSKFLTALLTFTRHPDLLAAAVSSSFG